MTTKIMVQGVAEVRVMPDHESIRVDVEGEGSSQEAAYETAAEFAKAVDTVLEECGSAIGRVVIAALVVQPKARWRKGEAVRTGWRGSRSTLVEIADAQDVGDVAWIAEPGLRPGSHRGDEYLEEMSAAAAGGSLHEEEQSIAVTPGEVTLRAAVEVAFQFPTERAPPKPA